MANFFNALDLKKPKIQVFFSTAYFKIGLTDTYNNLS